MRQRISQRLRPLRSHGWVFVLQRPPAWIHHEILLHCRNNRRLLKYPGVQHGEAVRDRTPTQTKPVHEARRKRDRAPRVAIAKDPLQGCEELQVEGICENLLIDGLRLYPVELLDHEVDRVCDPIEQRRKDLKNHKV